MIVAPLRCRSPARRAAHQRLGFFDDVKLGRSRGEGTEPLQADGTLSAEPGPHGAMQPAPGITPRVPDPEDAPYLELQEALRKRQTAAESREQSDHPAETGVERSEPTPRQTAWL